MGAQAYTSDDKDGIYTTDASWLASRLCTAVETDDERKQTWLNDGPGMDWTGDVLATTVSRAHSILPFRYALWLSTIDAEKWQGRRGVYSRCDWVAARRFIARCSRRSVGFHISY